MGSIAPNITGSCRIQVVDIVILKGHIVSVNVCTVFTATDFCSTNCEVVVSNCVMTLIFPRHGQIEYFAVFNNQPGAVVVDDPHRVTTYSCVTNRHVGGIDNHLPCDIASINDSAGNGDRHAATWS